MLRRAARPDGGPVAFVYVGRRVGRGGAGRRFVGVGRAYADYCKADPKNEKLCPAETR
jgi:hypothetical protein